MARTRTPSAAQIAVGIIRSTADPKVVRALLLEDRQRRAMERAIVAWHNCDLDTHCMDMAVQKLLKIARRLKERK